MCKYLRGTIDERLESVTLGEDGRYPGAAELVYNWQRFPNLKELKLDCPRGHHDGYARSRGTGDMSVESLSFAGWKCIEILGFRRSGLGFPGCIALARCSHKWPHLRRIDVHKNCIDEAGLQYLSSGSFPQLTELDLGENQIGRYTPSDFAAPAFRKFLSNCPSLRELRLEGNRLDDSFLKSLVEVTSLQLLEVLDLSENNFKDPEGKIWQNFSRGKLA